MQHEDDVVPTGGKLWKKTGKVPDTVEVLDISPTRGTNR